MTNTFLGYEVASPERQRKTALALVGVVCVLAIAGAIALYFASHTQHSGRELAVATITAFETKCRYVVRNISRRVSYYDHTGLIDCDRAHEVAAANDSVLGSVQKTTVALVAFTARDGSKIRSHVELDRREPASVGEQVQVLYLIDDPRDLREYLKLPLGFGKSSSSEPSDRPGGAAPAKSRPSDAVSESTKLWVGVATLVVGVLLAFFLIRALYRAARWLAGVSYGPKQPIESAAPIVQRRLEQVARRAADGGFGRRS